MHNSYKNITTATTTTFAGTEILRVVLASININKKLGGTVTINAGSTPIGVIAAGTDVGQYWYTNHGTAIEDMQIVTSATDNITVFYRNI